jgi:hypothetical protein
LARFIRARSKARFKQSLANPKMREKLRKALYHYAEHLDERHASLEAQHTLQDVHVQHVYSQLVAGGAPDVCVAFTDDPELDRDEIPLHEAVERLMWVGAGFSLLRAWQARAVRQ